MACCGATPIGITDCLNFGSPETELGAWQLERAIDGIADACRALGMPVVSGNVSLYNETPDGPILPTPVVGTVGVLEDRAAALAHGLGRRRRDLAARRPGRRRRDALAGSELAWRAAERGGRPALDVAAAARLVRLLPGSRRTAWCARRTTHRSAALGVALARMAIAAGVGARVELPASAGRPRRRSASASGRVIVGDRAGPVAGALAAALEAARVPATQARDRGRLPRRRHAAARCSEAVALSRAGGRPGAPASGRGTAGPCVVRGGCRARR